MPILDLCSKNLVTIEKDASLISAAKMMKKNHVGGLIVTEKNNSLKPVGILTDRDIVLGVIAENLPLNMRVQEIMSRNIATVLSSEGISNVIDHMDREGVRRMVVVDDTGNACGLVSSDDIVRLVAQELSSIGHLVESQIEKEKSHKYQQEQLVI
jgi:predicted transcriptional regulator